MPSKPKQSILRFIQWAVIASLSLGLTLGVVTPVKAVAEVVRFERLTSDQGLSQSWVRTILQDWQGYLWFGTEYGLNRYDGYEFEIYRHDLEDPDSLADSNVIALLEDTNHRLWVGTLNGLDRLDRDGNRFVHYHSDAYDPNSLGGMEISVLYQDRQGVLWVGTEDGGLSRYNAATDNFTRFQFASADPTSLSNNDVLSIFEDHNGILWVGTALGGLNALDPNTGKFTRYRANSKDSASLSSDAVRAIYEDSLGNLWVGTDTGGLNLFDRKANTFTHYRYQVDDAYSLSGDEVRVIYEDRSGELWVGTKAGLNRMDRNLGRFIRYRHDPSDPYSISSDSIWSLYEDRGGILWIGTGGGGVSKYAGSLQKFTLHQYRPDQTATLSDNDILAITEDRQGRLWVGTHFGGLDRLDDVENDVRVFRHNPHDSTSIAGDDVRALLVDHTGRLWVGLNRGGLDYLDPYSDDFVHLANSADDPAGLGEDRVATLFEDRDETLWVGLWTQGLDRLDSASKTFTHFRHDPADSNSLVDDRVRVIYQDKEGLFWIGTYGGFSIWDSGENLFTNYSNDPNNPDSLSNDIVRAFHEDASGNMWIATYGGGLNYFDRKTQKFSHYTIKNGLPSDALYSLLADETGEMWISSNSGLTHFDPKRISFRNYTTKDGLQGDEFNGGSAFRNAEGEMFFGGINGFNSFYPQQVADNSSVPPVVITAFRKFNKTVRTDLQPGETIELDYTDNFISFDFAALDYYAPLRNQYTYMLEGFDRQWVAAGTRRYASYTNLRGGDYVFRVRGSNSDGIWNVDGFSVNIHITPPFWERWWFFGMIAVVLAGGAFGAYRMRVQEIKDRNRSLEVQVRERTMEIERRQLVAEGLRKIISMLNSNYSLSESLDTILVQAAQFTGACCAYIFQTCEDCGDLAVLALKEDHNLSDEALRNWKGFIGDEVTNNLIRGQSMAVSDLSALRAETGESQYPYAVNHNALLAVPLPVSGKVGGGLILLFEKTRNLTQEEINLATTLADQASLAIANAQLRAQAEQNAIAAERSRLARDLHDAVTQTLFTTSLIADVLPRIWERNPEEGRKRLEQIRQLTRGALAEMRTLLLELRPASLTETNLADLVRQLSLAFTGRTQIPVEVSVEGNFVLPPDVQVTLYRIAQELLNNVAKHAQATQVSVKLSEVNGQILLQVCDNGKGFDIEAVPSGHMGLGIIRERATSVGATLDVESRPGDGTRVAVYWDGIIQES
ncbi:histidine kinase [Longilinea arvoryzae]|uniref:Histidine kinase n=1 Tax=Longilinea arvoryzae TaxID=360412 RepID=A0A0S7B8I8_9CHLR|nr:two-component regulator propeller domain-containing protein [Longilinea arvoryzae]GAP13836.1 histidine kinase [Longilinea arvoryzae]